MANIAEMARYHLGEQKFDASSVHRVHISDVCISQGFILHVPKNTIHRCDILENK